MSDDQTTPAVAGLLDGWVGRPDQKRACRGAPTVAYRSGAEHMERCTHCEIGVRADLVEHPFFGFKTGCCESR